MAALDSKLQDGLALHRQGKIAEAERLFMEVLRHDPQHLLALQLLGFITFQRDKIALRRLEDKLAAYDKDDCSQARRRRRICQPGARFGEVETP